MDVRPFRSSPPFYAKHAHQMDDDDAINSKGTPAQLPPAYRANHACAPTLPSPSATDKQRRRCRSETTSIDSISVNSSSNSTGIGSSNGTGNDRQRNASSLSSTGPHEASAFCDAGPAETAPRIEDVAMHAKLSLTEGEVVENAVANVSLILARRRSCLVTAPR